MKASEIIIGEKYFFVATDSATRKHLEGTEFLVTEKKRVWRRVKGRRANVYRFFNEWGEGARAEELEPISEFEKLKDSVKKIVGCLETIKHGFEVIAAGHPANIQPGDYQDKDDLPF